MFLLSNNRPAQISVVNDGTGLSPATGVYKTLID